MTTHDTTIRQEGLLDRLNGVWHERALWLFMVVVLGHWAEHIIQGVQIWVFDMPRPESLGGLGILFPVLVSSETMHFTFAVLMLGGLFLLGRGFQGASGKWWKASLAFQGWHFIEHAVLFGQVLVGANLFGSPVPSSLLQPFVPRPELHLFYNFIVFVPMVVAMWLHTRPAEDDVNACSCALSVERPMVGEPVSA